MRLRYIDFPSQHFIRFFPQNFGPFTVSENKPIGTTVGQVSAEDKDIELNAKITYSITGSVCYIRAIMCAKGFLFWGC